MTSFCKVINWRLSLPFASNSMCKHAYQSVSQWFMEWAKLCTPHETPYRICWLHSRPSPKTNVHKLNVPPCLSEQFHVLTKFLNKFDCLIKMMLFSMLICGDCIEIKSSHYLFTLPWKWCHDYAEISALNMNCHYHLYFEWKTTFEIKLISWTWSQ